MNNNYSSLFDELEKCNITTGNENRIRNLCHLIINTHFKNKRKRNYALSLCREKLNELEIFSLYSSGDLLTPFITYNLTSIVFNTLSAAEFLLQGSELFISCNLPCPVFAVCSEKLVIRAVCEIIECCRYELYGNIKFEIQDFKSYSLLSVTLEDVKQYRLTKSDLHLQSILMKIAEIHSGTVLIKTSYNCRKICLTLKKQNSEFSPLFKNAKSANEILCDKLSTPYLIFKPEKF